LDFFANSGSTGHAVLDLNKKDGGSRRFILVQLPQPTEEGSAARSCGLETIAEITKERLRRIRGTTAAAGGQQEVLEAVVQTEDRGFRVFKLDESNFKTWESEKPKDAQALAKQLELHVNHVRDGRTSNDLLFEILLKSGFPITTAVATLTIAGKQIYSVAGGALLICLERELTLDLIRAIAERRPERVACLDAGFAGNDQLKANAVQIFRDKGVTSFKSV
jgi:adenine-specific DNA-methyltransferase